MSAKSSDHRYERIIKTIEEKTRMAGLEFDPGPHAYRSGGQSLASVTEILKSVGFIDDRFYTPQARARGEAVHKACQYWVNGSLDDDSIHPLISPYLAAFRSWFSEHVQEVLLCEKPLYHPTLFIAGTPDLLIISKDKKRPIVVDIKSGPPEFWAAHQTAAYADMISVLAGGAIRPERMVLHLTPQGRFNIIPYQRFKDLEVFKSAVACHYEKTNGR